MSTDHSVPAFSTALRGYDRDQVDRHVMRLDQELRDARRRADTAQDALVAREPSLSGVGSRIDTILAEARSQGYDLVAQSEEDARSLMNTAHEEALDMVGQARRHAEQLTREAAAVADRRADDIVAAAEVEARGLLDAARAAVTEHDQTVAAAAAREVERERRDRDRAAGLDAAHRAALDLARTLQALSGQIGSTTLATTISTPREDATSATGRARVTSIALPRSGPATRWPLRRDAVPSFADSVGSTEVA